MKKSNIITILLFVFFLASVALGYFFPGPTFSEMEKRYLADMPKWNWTAVLDGSWGKQTDTYLIDHIPERNLFVGLNAYCEQLLGLQKTKSIWVLDGKLVRRPVEPQAGALEKNIGAVNRFAASIDIPVSLALIPSCGFSLGAPEYPDDRLIEEIYEKAESETIDLRDIYRGRPELFYSTDHHWTSAGAFAGYESLMAAWGREAEKNYTVECFDRFRGANFSASGLWLTPAETLEMWSGPAAITVETGHETHEGVFYRERLAGYDPYMVFLDGNQPFVRLRNPNGTGRLLLIRDSFASSLAGFLAQSYEEVALVDLRYYKQPISQLAEGFDQILVLYSLENFLTDSNIVLMK